MSGCYRERPSVIHDLCFGLHSNIPLCCVVQWLFEQYVIIPLFVKEDGMLGLPWRAWRYWRDQEPDRLGEVAQYWPCSIHTWLIEHGWVKPRMLYVCDMDGPLGAYAMQCPRCMKG